MYYRVAYALSEDEIYVIEVKASGIMEAIQSVVGNLVDKEGNSLIPNLLGINVLKLNPELFN